MPASSLLDFLFCVHTPTRRQWAVTFTLAKVPIEEVFFFVIQSIFTSQLYVLLGLFETPTQHLNYSTQTWTKKLLRWGPLPVLAAICLTGWRIAVPETHTFYLGCISWWITPIMAFLWTIAGDHFLSRARTAILTIAIPTVYLCLVDTIALRAGTWHITERTSTGIFVWKDLPLEEAVFFLVTNTLLTCGMSAFERSFAVIDVFGDVLASNGSVNNIVSPRVASSSSGGAIVTSPKPSMSRPWELVLYLVRSLLLRIDSLPISFRARIPTFEKTQQVLAVHSRSFHTASYIFPSAVRRDLVILYAFCRVLDDFCDESATKEEAEALIAMSKDYLDLVYPRSSPYDRSHSSASDSFGKSPFFTASAAPCGEKPSVRPSPSLSGPQQQPSHYAISAFLHKRVPPEAQSAFFLLSTISGRIPRYPFDDLIEGYEWDLAGRQTRPIRTTADLIEYSRLVAASVAEMCVWAMWANEGLLEDEEERKRVLDRASSMGIALQITNISRDIREDATKGRIYLPEEWFLSNNSKEPSADVSDSLEHDLRQRDYNNLLAAADAKRAPSPTEFRYPTYIRQLLDLADQHKIGTSEAIRKLPRSCQAGIRAATGVYIGIGSEISKKAFTPTGAANPDFDGHRVSLTGKQRVLIALKEVYGRR